MSLQKSRASWDYYRAAVGDARRWTRGFKGLDEKERLYRAVQNENGYSQRTCLCPLLQGSLHTA